VWIMRGRSFRIVCVCSNVTDNSSMRIGVTNKKRRETLSEAFPRGSLIKYLTPERDREQLAVLASCVCVPSIGFNKALAPDIAS
jgi:hypothetical protein